MYSGICGATRQLKTNSIMETKKKLRADVQRLFTAIDYLEQRVAKLELINDANADLIPAREAAKMLGYKSNFISSRLLTQKGIEHKKNEYGLLQISRKSVEQYLESRKTTNED